MSVLPVCLSSVNAMSNGSHAVQEEPRREHEPQGMADFPNEIVWLVMNYLHSDKKLVTGSVTIFIDNWGWEPDETRVVEQSKEVMTIETACHFLKHVRTVQGFTTSEGAQGPSLTVAQYVRHNLPMFVVDPGSWARWREVGFESAFRMGDQVTFDLCANSLRANLATQDGPFQHAKDQLIKEDPVRYGERSSAQYVENLWSRILFSRDAGETSEISQEFVIQVHAGLKEYTGESRHAKSVMFARNVSVFRKINISCFDRCTRWCC